MSIDSKISSQLERLNQQHVLELWQNSNEAERARLNEQLSHVDWPLIENYQSDLNQTTTASDSSATEIEPPAHVARMPRDQQDRERWTQARELGEKVLRSGEVAAVLLAGGQGTRLGFNHPKGMFEIGPVSGKSLFAIFAEQLLAISDRVGRAIPYFIMTSDETHEPTIEFFRSHNNFGLNPADLFFFKQGYAPALDIKTGQLLIGEGHTLCMTPDGHGGLLTALHKAGIFDEMRRRGIEYVYTHQVDNPLTKICDPAFLGLHIENGAEVSTKVVAKLGPEEKVGVAVELNGHTAIVEYIDLPQELANQREADGSLRYWAGSTAIHTFNREFLERVATSTESLPWHRAKKKIACVDQNGVCVRPEVENGVKFERFLFDTMPLAKKALIVETDRFDEFAPLKNSSGDFSPDYVRKQLVAVATKWLEEAGVTVPPSAIVEISPVVALSANELAERLPQLPPLDFRQPVYLERQNQGRVNSTPENKSIDSSAMASSK